MDMLIFDDLEKLGRIVLTTVLVYVMIVLVTKVSGKRSTSQLNNFDWIMTVMIGSLGASTILLKNIPLVEGGAAIITLYLLQYMVTKYAAISPQFSDVILSDPRIVFYKGQFLPDAMRQERLTRQELECAMRSAGINDIIEVEAIVFESDAKLTVIKNPPENHNSERDDQISQTIVSAMRDNT
ncbi:DUF421 domain-containing protein [Psychrobacter aestuarii]|uniref:YetF C-terminal domain-containing protein n=1 Tax=Psychrobacter aestuarii TaxID=556327 RepID=A0ABN0VM54_9GAMM|nr:YetF domain-containing protein [Psychrobacter aestuarii]